MKILNIILLFMFVWYQGYSQIKFPLQEHASYTGKYQLKEKIILETDREFYMVGEEIYIACQSYEPVLQRILELSKIVYIEFYTSRNQIIEQVKIEMDKGIGSGFVKIPKRLSSGIYYVRAYTNYMKNLGCEGFSYSSVTVLNPFQELSPEGQNNSSVPTLQKCSVHPEGGQVVYGSPNTMVCEFSDNTGHPVPCNARVIDNNNQIVAGFSTNNYGLGSFVFSPRPNTGYRMEATSGEATIYMNIDIPEHAIALTKVRQDEQELQFRLLRYHYSEYPLQLKVMGSNSSVLIMIIAPKDSLITLKREILPKGIIQFRLQNSGGEILSFRNIYNSPNQYTELQLHTNKSEYGNRETVELAIESCQAGMLQEPLSVSVFMIENKNKADFFRAASQEFFKSSLYPFLSGSSFPANEVMRNAEFLENVLIAKKPGDSIPVIPDESTYQNLVYFPEIKQDLIFGTLLDDQKISMPSSVVWQTWIDTVSTLQTTRTNKEGKFIFLSERTGENRLILTHNKTTQGNIVLQEEFFPEFFSITEEKIHIDPENRNVLKQQMLNLQINDSYFENGKNGIKKTLLPFYLAPDKTFRISDFIPLSTLQEFLFEVVPGVLSYHYRNKTIIRMHFPQTDISFGDDPLFLVDGIPVFDADYIGNMKCSEISSVGVVYEKYFYQNESFDGILDIHTRKGDASILHIPESVNSLYFTGIQPKQTKDEFSIQDANSPEPFFKTQLYWNPSLFLKPTGKTTLTFITPDNSGDYLIRCCLKSMDGSLGYYYTSFSVR